MNQYPAQMMSRKMIRCRSVKRRAPGGGGVLAATSGVLVELTNPF